jgi:hypothetical protein
MAAFALSRRGKLKNIQGKARGPYQVFTSTPVHAGKVVKTLLTLGTRKSVEFV